MEKEGVGSGLIQWSQDLSVCNEVLDNQHKILIEKINTLYDISTHTHDPRMIEDALDFLEGYAKKHFAYEESYFLTHEFPEAYQHCEMHKTFVSRVKNMRHQLIKYGESKELAKEIAEFSAEWIKTHIKKADARYCAFIKDGVCQVKIPERK